MTRSCLGLALVACFLLAAGTAAQEAPALITVSGLVDKTDKDSLTIRPRGPDGKFGKSLVLKVTGTSKLTTLSQRKAGGKVTLVQRDTDLKDLQKNQAIGAIYATGADGAVLLAAVLQPAK
jgi:hypothetical protein